MIRVLIAEHMHLLRSGLAALLDDEEDIAVVETVECGEKILPLGLEVKPDVALLAIDLPGTDGFTVAETLRDELPSCAAVIMAGRRRPGDLRRAVAAGAVGFLLKDSSPDKLSAAIRRVSRGDRVIDADLAFAELSAVQSPLTPRELDVLRLAAEGASAAQIADTLVLTVGTVRNHLSRINGKVGAHNQVHAIRIAENAGWL